MQDSKSIYSNQLIKSVLSIGITAGLIIAIEWGKHSAPFVPIPFLLLYVSVVIAGSLSGKWVGGASGILASLFVVHAADVGFGPQTLIGGVPQLLAGVFLYTATGFLVGRIRDNRDKFLSVIRLNEAKLESEVLARTEELRESENTYRSILDNIEETFYRTDIDGRIVMVSPSVENLLGYGIDEIIGKNLADFYANPEDRTAFLKELERSGGRVNGYQCSLRHKDGHEVWVSTNAHYYRDKEQDILGVEGTSRNITEQKFMQEQAERLMTAIDGLNDCLVIFDEDDRIVSSNKAWQKLNSKINRFTVPGVKFEDHLRAAIEAGLIPGAVGCEEQWLRERMERHRTPLGPFDVSRQDGKWMRTNEQRLPDGGCIVINIDITELKQSEAQIRDVLDNSPIGVAIISHSDDGERKSDGRMYINQALVEMFGAKSHEELLGSDIPNSWADPNRFREAEEIRGSGGQLVNFEALRRRMDGGEWWCLMNSRPIMFHGELCTMNWHSDITERKRIEEALRASEERLEGILRIAPEAVIVIGTDQNIRHFNQGAERVFGYTAKEMIGEPLDILLPPNVRKVHNKHIEGFAQSADDFRIMDSRNEVFAVRKDGSIFPAKASLSKLDLQGEQIFVALLHDITATKKAEELIVASKRDADIANRAKSEFLANMSHELRTPLNAILGFSEMIKSEIWGQIGNHQYLEYADAVHVSGSHLLEIINDILDLSKIEAGEAVIENTDVDIDKTIESCFLMVAGRAKKAGVELQYVNPNQQAIVSADLRHLKQVLINLLTNAIKFTPSGGHVSIACRIDEAGGHEISVTDTGVGIAKENIVKILQPFGQVANSQIRNHEGTGLGLPICKSLMELHGGQLELESEINQGTKVTARFPPERTVRS